MSQSAAAIERARADVAAGRPWKARERLRSYLAARPTDQEAIDLLGEVQSALGDVPAAGRAWLLSERDDDRTRAAIATLWAEHGGSARRLVSSFKVRAPEEAWPAVVRERLQTIRAQAATEGVDWAPGQGVVATDGEVEAGGGGLFVAGCLLLLAVLAVAAAVGLVTIAVWLVERAG